MVATKQARNIQGSQQNGRENNFYRDYQHQEYYEDKVHPRVLSISKATRPSRRLICSLLSSVHAIPEKLAQRLLVSGLSVGQSPFSLLLFLRHWVSLSLFSRLIYDECKNPLVTCVYIEPVQCLGVCAVKQFVTSRDPRLPREWAAGRRQKHIPFSPPRCARGSRNNEQSISFLVHSSFVPPTVASWVSYQSIECNNCLATGCLYLAGAMFVCVSVP
ncbi:unnamed protein product [Boreogadus saida]